MPSRLDKVNITGNTLDGGGTGDAIGPRDIKTAQAITT